MRSTGNSQKAIASALRTPRIAINFGSGLLPGLDLVLAGAALAADRLGWEVVGLRDGYDGLLFPERYPEGGLVPLRPRIVDAVGCGGSIIDVQPGNFPASHPLRVRGGGDPQTLLRSGRRTGSRADSERLLMHRAGRDIRQRCWIEMGCTPTVSERLPAFPRQS
jgi:hypothetical protein